jgi:hypothetical protein
MMSDQKVMATHQTSYQQVRSLRAKLLTKDEARRIACDDGGSRKDKRPNISPAVLATSNHDALNEAYMPFDFLELLPFFFVAMALLLECAPTRRNSGALQMNAE